MNKATNDNVIPVQFGEPTGDCVFHCGAKIRDVRDPTPHCSHGDRRGRFRLVVYDSHAESITTPTHDDGKRSSCMYGCPCKRDAGRKQERGFPPDYEEQTAMGAEVGKDFAWQWWVTCYGYWQENEK